MRANMNRRDFHRDYSPLGHSLCNLRIRFFLNCLAGRPGGRKKSPTGGVRRNHHSDSYPLPRRSASQAEGRSLASDSFGFREADYQLQWRDRAGLSPASLFSPDLSGQPNGFSRLLIEDSLLRTSLSPNNSPSCQVWSIAIIADRDDRFLNSEAISDRWLGPAGP